MRHDFLSGIVGMFLRSKLSVLLIIFSLVVGAAALVATPREEDPQIVVPLADVYVEFPGRTAHEVEQLVTTPLERILYQIDGVEHVYSMSRENQAIITVRFYVGQDRERSLVKLFKKLGENTDAIPPGVELRVEYEEHWGGGQVTLRWSQEGGFSDRVLGGPYLFHNRNDAEKTLTDRTGPIALWKGEGNGADSSGLASDLKLHNNISFAPGWRGQAFSLNGKGACAVADSGVDGTGKPVSIDAFINREGFLIVGRRTGTGNNTHNAQTNKPLALGEWTRVTAVFGGDKDFRIYLDGLPVEATITLGTIPLEGSTTSRVPASTVIGGAEDGCRHFFAGLIDEVAIYDRALSASEIQVGGGASK